MEDEAKTSSFRKFRQLLMAKHFENKDNIPIKVLSGLYIGSFGAANNLFALQEVGITHILCVSSTLPMPYQNHFQYLRLAVEDVHNVRIIESFAPAIEFINSAINSGGKVLVHCYVGRSRSATIVLAYLMVSTRSLCNTQHPLSLNDAIAMLQRIRPEIRPNRGFLAQLRDCERDFSSLIRVITMDGRALLSYASGSAAKQQVQMPKDDDEENIMDCDNDMILNKDDYELIRAFHRLVPLPALSSKIVRILCDEEIQVTEDYSIEECDNNQKRDIIQKKQSVPSIIGSSSQAIPSFAKHSPLARRLSKPHREVNLANLTPKIPSRGTCDDREGV